ncbi:GNAT family N-acetyltransferase [Chitinophaga sp. MM2321]|uniref:GNAT family N-acetyltransferase n=1 Tax=Chitinophaga sp. MM2321 TaxID=3137178 RepID=UPI0032D58997
MENINVRKAVPADLEILLGFEQGVIEAERPFDTTLKEGLIHYYDIAAMMTADHVELVVAETGSEIIGSGYARIEAAKPYVKHATYAYLGFMYVRPDYRGKGVNGKIVAALKEWSYLQGITEMRLDVYSDNETALRAYRKMGFVPNLVEMKMDLNDDPSFLV